MNNEKMISQENKELSILLMGRNGGRTTIRIIDEILVKPHNANQLSNKLNLDYNTIIHHTNIMKEYEFITKNEIGKAFYFHPTDKLIKYIDEYYTIKQKMQI
ncbi:winged helix-turn-helix domain-containing protein [Methanobrevibacter sp. V14]|uniref:winged helix-turn-helix domain-containing protein n=1 Tax=Methanobrevibacter sp. V14 TaxID=3064280 RepID=UPI002732CF27|nr:winged helix-turn-helix domain-containing protein [Methanobrevibacter sp. V14]